MARLASWTTASVRVGTATRQPKKCANKLAVESTCDRNDVCASNTCAYGTSDIEVCCKSGTNKNFGVLRKDRCSEQPDGAPCELDDGQCSSGYCDKAAKKCANKLAVEST